MHRSGSANRFSDDPYSYYASSSPSSKVPTALRALSDGRGNSHLPMYEPSSEIAKKEKGRARFAAKAVHVIPMVLLLCAIILWIFSNPDINIRGSSVAEEIQGLANEGNLASDDTGHLPIHLGRLSDPITHANTISKPNGS